MAKQTINIGTVANDGTGDALRDAFEKVNDNFNELYAGAGSANVVPAFDKANSAFTLANNAYNYVNTIQYSANTYANLVSAVTAGAGARAYVTDSNTNVFLSIVGGGGANNVPVSSDGSNWYVG